MAMVAAENSTTRRRNITGAKLAPIESANAPAARKIFSKKDLVESVRKMAPARYGVHGAAQISSGNLSIPTAEGGSQIKVMEEGVNANAARYNELKLLADRKTKELRGRLDTLQSLKLENQALTDMKQKATPEAIRIEELLEKIEETRVMTEDKLHYRRQLQHMLRRLQTNQITFDAHINAMEDAMQSAIKEHDDVKSLMRQLEAGKTKAVLDLYEAQRQVSTERRDRSKVVSVRKLEAFNARKMEEWRNQLEQSHQDASSSTVQKGDLTAEEERTLRTRLEERGKLADQLKDANAAKLRELNLLEEQFSTIRQATGVSDLNEMVDKFIGQEGNRQTLLKEQKEVEVKLVAARKAKDEAEANFAELKASGVGSNELNREVSAELSSEIQAGRMELKVTRAACDRQEKVLVALRQGAIGLFQRLEHLRYLLDGDDDDFQPRSTAGSATIDPVEALGVSELILAKMVEHVGGGESSPRTGAAAGDADSGDDDDETAPAAPDDVSATWAASSSSDRVPSARLNVRVKTLAEFQNPEQLEYSMMAGKTEPFGKDVAVADTDDDGAQSSDIVPTRDFLKLSSSRQHAEVARKEAAELKRKKMQERIDAADDKEKEKLGSLADKKQRQKDAIDHLCQKKEMMGVPSGVNPKQDAMTRSQIFLRHAPELL